MYEPPPPPSPMYGGHPPSYVWGHPPLLCMGVTPPPMYGGTPSLLSSMSIYRGTTSCVDADYYHYGGGASYYGGNHLLHTYGRTASSHSHTYCYTSVMGYICAEHFDHAEKHKPDTVCPYSYPAFLKISKMYETPTP